jgi:hypothetical protein
MDEHMRKVWLGLAVVGAIGLAACAGYVVANIPNPHQVQMCVAIAQHPNRSGERVGFSDQSSGCFSDEWTVCGYFRNLDTSRSPGEQDPGGFVSQEC